MKSFINKLLTALSFVCVMLMMSSCYSRSREASQRIRLATDDQDQKYTVNTYTDSSRISLEVIKRGDKVIYYDSAVYSQRYAKLPSYRHVEDYR